VIRKGYSYHRPIIAGVALLATRTADHIADAFREAAPHTDCRPALENNYNMIIFCEECGARNNVSSDSLDANLHTFECCQCGQVLMVSKPTMGSGGFHAFSKMEPECQIKQADTPITVLLVDDSTVLRKIIKDMFASDDRLQVVGEAEHGLKALELIPQLKPDVVTLDVNMPVMDGMTAIKHIMIKCPTPVVMFSTLTGQGSLETFETLAIWCRRFSTKALQPS
jgi:two-component system chemotaxis response regulator CheB